MNSIINLKDKKGIVLKELLMKNQLLGVLRKNLTNVEQNLLFHMLTNL